MKKSNRIEGDRLTAPKTKQVRRNRGATGAQSKKDKAVLLAIKEGRAVVVELPGEKDEARTCIDLMLRLYPGLTHQAVAQHLVNDGLDQARKDIELMDTYGYWAHEEMIERQAPTRRTRSNGKAVLK